MVHEKGQRYACGALVFKCSDGPQCSFLNLLVHCYYRGQNKVMYQLINDVLFNIWSSGKFTGALVIDF